MTKIAIMQPYFFPYLGYYQLINEADIFILYDDINFIKKGWINRNKLLSNQEGSKFFTLPLEKQSSNKLIKEIKVSNNKWKKKLLNLLHHEYKHSPFFEETMDVINSCLQINSQFISEINAYSINKISSHIGIKTKIISDCKINELEKDLQSNQYIDGGILYRKEVRIFEICKHYNSNHYINAIGGKKLYDPNLFEQENIKLNFIKMNTISYHQKKSNSFIENLSIIDVLMNCGKRKTQQHLSEYSLIN